MKALVTITMSCPMPPVGWRCTRPIAHEGPCAVVPRWYNQTRFARAVRRGMR